MKSILFITNLPNFYRCKFFNLLSKNFDLDVLFTLCREESTRSDSFFFDLNQAKFHYSFSKGIKLGKLKIAASVPKILKKTHDIVVIGLLDDLIAIRCAEYLISQHCPYILSFDGMGRRNCVVDAMFGRYARNAQLCMSPSSGVDAYIREIAPKQFDIQRYHFSSFEQSKIDNRVTSFVEKQNLKQKYCFNPNRPLVLGVGQVIRRKGFDTLFESLRLVETPSSVLIVGGHSDELLETYRDVLEMHEIAFMDNVDQKELETIYRMSDVFVLPTRGDSWGLVIPEAMSHGLPVISTYASGAAVELISKENGFLVPPDDSGSLAHVLSALLIDQNRREQMGANNLHKIIGWTVEGMAESTKLIVNSYLDDKELL